MESFSKLASSLEVSATPTLDSSSELLFPTLTTNKRLSRWIQKTTKRAMTPSSELPSDERSLTESAYEFIETDDESRDDNHTESVASTDFFRSDDITSLEGTECSVEDSEEEEEDLRESHHSVLLDQTVEEAFNAPTIVRSSQENLDDIDQFLSESIEFEEPLSVNTDAICVRHTIAHLNEDQSESALQGISTENRPEKLMITVRQTMIKQGLSTREPLRILYVGSHSAKQDIIHKIASSVTASVESETQPQNLHYSTSQLYNVVPISAFGSEKTPEIELMHSSGYQIKVDDCHSAEYLKAENISGKPDVIKLFIDDNFVCHSVPSGDGHFATEPPWELPHIAVFHCSNSDDFSMKQTRTITRNFTNRHRIPSIVISHKMMLNHTPYISLDENSPHMCLESRDPKGRGFIVHQRFPIDLSSFLNIDARQMNRNLAYLTGLHVPLDNSNRSEAKNNRNITDTSQMHDLGETSSIFRDGIKLVLNQNFHSTWSIMPKVFVFVLLVAFLKGFAIYKAASVPAISINSKIVLAAPISSSPIKPDTFFVTEPATPSISTTTKVSTQTTTITQYLSLGSIFVAEKNVRENIDIQSCSETQLPTKDFSCTAEIYGENEILIRTPAANRVTWFNNEVIAVNITRANITIEAKRAYSSRVGIILSLPKKEAYGVINVSIITTKKPRVKETFTLDFGSITSQALLALKKRISTFIPRDSKLNSKCLSRIRKEAARAAGDALTRLPLVFSDIDSLHVKARHQATRASEKFTKAAHLLSIMTVKNSAIISKVVAAQSTEAQKFFHQLEEPILSARIQSKILWLKLQRKDREAKIYQEKAAAALSASRRNS